MRYLFGDFVLDDGTRQLSQAGRELPLGAKGFELLDQLLKARPRVLSRTRLTAALWPDTHVGQTSLHVLVSQVRALLDDDPEDPRWIRTAHGVGYAFRGEVRQEGGEPPPPAGGPRRASLHLGAREWLLPQGEHVIGRGADAAVVLDAAGVSRHHARLRVGVSEVTIEDLGSKNGTFLGERRVSSPRRLADGDLIRLGKRISLVYRRDEGEPTESEAPTHP